MVSCCILFDVRSFVLEVGSWSSNDAAVTLPNECYCLFWQGRARSQDTALPYKVLIWTKGRQVGSCLRSPDPAQLSSLREPGTQDSIPQVLQASGTRSLRLWPRQMAAAAKLQRQGWGRRSLPPQGPGPISGWPWQGPWGPVGPSPPPWAPQFTHWPEAGWAGEPWAEGQDSPFLAPPLMTTTPPTNGWTASLMVRSLKVGLWAARCETAHWLSRTTNAHSETVWAGPIVMPTNRAHCPVTVESDDALQWLHAKLTLLS